MKERHLIQVWMKKRVDPGRQFGFVTTALTIKNPPEGLLIDMLMLFDIGEITMYLRQVLMTNEKFRINKYHKIRS